MTIIAKSLTVSIKKMRHGYHSKILTSVSERERNENHQPTHRDDHYDGNYLDVK